MSVPQGKLDTRLNYSFLWNYRFRTMECFGFFFLSLSLSFPSSERHADALHMWATVCNSCRVVRAENHFRCIWYKCRPLSCNSCRRLARLKSNVVEWGFSIIGRLGLEFDTWCWTVVPTTVERYFPKHGTLPALKMMVMWTESPKHRRRRRLKVTFVIFGDL